MVKKICEDEFNLDPEKWQKHALDEPIIITEKDVPKLYLLSKPVFDSLYKDSRQHFYTWELSEEEKKEIRETDMSPEHDHLNALLKED